MANAATVRNGFDTLIAENWSDEVRDTIADEMPLLWMFMGRNGDKNNGDGIGLGIPNSGMLLSGMKNARVRTKEILSSNIYQPLIHNALPSAADGKVMGRASSMPETTNWQTTGPITRFQRPSVKWCDIADPCEVPNEDILQTQAAAAGERNGWKAIGDLMKVERSDRLIQHCRRWNKMLMGTLGASDILGMSYPVSITGSPTSETPDRWDAFHSIKAALAASGLYCGVDRDISTGVYFRGNTITAATAPVFRDMIRNANYGITLNNADGTTSMGLGSKGASLDVILVGGPLFSIALSEAESVMRQAIIPAGTPIAEFGQFGFKKDLVRIDNTFIVFVPGMAANEAYGLNLKTWTFAIHPKQNFKQSTPTDQSNVKGGDDSTTWTIRTKAMVVCEVPGLNVAWTNVA